MAQSLVFTRFLYAKDEVELSLLTALLKNEDLQVIYYWTYELYYSGFDVFELLWKIYLDFYYEQHSYFEVYFKKKHKLWKSDGNMKHIAYIVRNMYNLSITNNVFMIRQNVMNNDECLPTVIYRFKKKPVWLNDYDKQYHNLLLSLERRHFENVCYYLKVLLI